MHPVRRAHRTLVSATSAVMILSGLLPVGPASIALADSTAQTLPFAQAWTSTSQIAANDDWSGVPGVNGYRGDGLTTATAVDPQTVVADGTGVIDVNANLLTPNTFATGGVSEFEITDPVVALQGSGTARAPHIVIALDTTGASAVNVAYNLRDIDGSMDNAVQPVALQFRVGGSGNYTNVPTAFVADASSGPSLATLVTSVSVALPAAAADQALVEVRILTTDAVGSDEWIGIDDIAITDSGPVTPNLTIDDVSANEGNAGTTTFSFTVSLSAAAPAGGVTFDIATADDSATTADSDYVANSLTGQTIPAGNSTYSFDVTVNGDATVEPDEAFFVNVTDVTGATVGDGQGTGTIVDDDNVTRIHAIQGGGDTAAPGTFTVEATVVGDYQTQGSGQLRGFFLQEEDADADADPATSEGIFVFCSGCPVAVSVADAVRVTGTSSDFNRDEPADRHERRERHGAQHGQYASHAGDARTAGAQRPERGRGSCNGCNQRVLRSPRGHARPVPGHAVRERVLRARPVRSPSPLRGRTAAHVHGGQRAIGCRSRRSQHRSRPPNRDSRRHKQPSEPACRRRRTPPTTTPSLDSAPSTSSVAATRSRTSPASCTGHSRVSGPIHGASVL